MKAKPPTATPQLHPAGTRLRMIRAMAGLAPGQVGELVKSLRVQDLVIGEIDGQRYLLKIGRDCELLGPERAD